MIAVARLTAYKPKISTENAATDRKLFVCHFPLSFLREIWLLTYTVLTYMGRGNVARVSMRGRWIVHDDIMIMIMMMTMKMKKPLRSRVWPLMTIRKRRWGVRLSEELGEAETKIRGLEEFRKNLPPFWKNLNRPCPSQRNFLRITVFILRAQRRAYGLGPFFLECWQMSLKFLRLVPIQLGRREQVYSPTLSTRPNPTPQLTKTLEMSERMSKIIFLRLRDNCFLHGNRFKTWVILWIFLPPIHWYDTQLVCVDRAEKDKDSYRKNAKMTYYLFCPPFHSESKELTTERTT